MSIYKKALMTGIARIFSLPRLSIPLILTLGLTLGAVLSVVAISSTLFYKPLEGVHNEQSIQTYQYRLQFSEVMSISYWSMRRLADFNESFKELGTWAGINASNQDITINDINIPTTQFIASDTILEVLETKLLKGQDVTIAAPEDYVWISNSLWQSAYTGIDSAIGKQVNFNNKNYIIAGIIEDLMSIDSNETILAEQVWFITNLKEALSLPETGRISNELEVLLLKGKIGTRVTFNFK